MLPFHIYDVFTATPFTGNPLAIVEGADGLSTAQMQTMARQFNLSETIFVQTPDDPAHTAKVRIFTPNAEIPFAGHPTIGCAIHLAGGTADHVTLEEVAGLVPVNHHGRRARRSSPPPLPPPRNRARPADHGSGPRPRRGRPRPHAPGAFEGGPAVPLRAGGRSRRAGSRVPNPAGRLMRDAVSRPRATPGRSTPMCRRRSGPIHPGAHVRPARRYREDPATGSATAILSGSFWPPARWRRAPPSWSLQQGVEMGRPSDLRLSIDVAKGAITAIRVAGQAVKVAEGTIAVPAG
jgi:trans-2,3-dihydro-3-hydroxyanthranilate isomerase